MKAEQVAHIEKHFPPLREEHVTLAKLKRLKVALWVVYVILPISLISFLVILVLDDNHPIAESLPLALIIISGFSIFLSAFLYIVVNPIFRRLMNITVSLDEGELYLQRQAYAFAYRIIFRSLLFIPILSVVVQLLNKSVFLPLNFPAVDGYFIPLTFALTLIFMMFPIILLPMVYLVRNLKPISEEG